jgi:hypothetical protein
VNCFRGNGFHGGRLTTAAAAADGVTISCFYVPCNVIVFRLVRKVDFCYQSGRTNFIHL